MGKVHKLLVFLFKKYISLLKAITKEDRGNKLF